ncbi:MAG: hypothetical protein ACFCUQ_21230 [Kiloniellales bacterium]
MPASQGNELKNVILYKTGVAAAAKSDGRVGDGEVTIEEWETAEPIKLPNHEVYQLAAGTLEPVAGIGDLLIVSNYASVNARNLVVMALGKRLLARRYNVPDSNPGIAVLTGQAIDPYDLPQPIIVPLDLIEPRKVVGTIFASHLLFVPLSDKENEILPLSDAAIVRAALKDARLFQIKGRSAEPIALEGQFLITHSVEYNSASLNAAEGQLVVAVDESGARYFKRLRLSGPVAVLESLNPDGTTPTELLSLDGALGLPKLTGLLTVAGVLFELP